MNRGDKDMEFIRSSSEEEMISVFLKTEINSERYAVRLKRILDDLEIDISVISDPNIYDNKENVIRKKVLGEYRGYDINIKLFKNFPLINRWDWVLLSKNEIEKIKYIDYSYWNELSNGTRLAKEAVKNIRKGVKVYNISNDSFIKASNELLNGKEFPPMIILSDLKEDFIVVLEGHLRLTAYMLEPDTITNGLKAIVGYTSKNELKNW